MSSMISAMVLADACGSCVGREAAERAHVAPGRWRPCARDSSSGVSPFFFARSRILSSTSVMLRTYVTFDALRAQVPHQQVGRQRGARVAGVRHVVNRRPAAVDASPRPALRRRKRLGVAGQRVVEAKPEAMEGPMRVTARPAGQARRRIPVGASNAARHGVAVDGQLARSRQSVVAAARPARRGAGASRSQSKASRRARVRSCSGRISSRPPKKPPMCAKNATPPASRACRATTTRRQQVARRTRSRSPATPGAREEAEEQPQERERVRRP